MINQIGFTTRGNDVAGDVCQALPRMELLEDDGRSVRVRDPHKHRPLDHRIADLVKLDVQGGRLVVLLLRYPASPTPVYGHYKDSSSYRTPLTTHVSQSASPLHQRPYMVASTNTAPLIMVSSTNTIPIIIVTVAILLMPRGLACQMGLAYAWRWPSMAFSRMRRRPSASYVNVAQRRKLKLKSIVESSLRCYSFKR